MAGGWRCRVESACDPCLHLVSRQQRPVGGAGRSAHRQLPRWTAPRSCQRKSRRRVGCVLSAWACGDSPACACQCRPDQTRGTARHGRLILPPAEAIEDTVSQATFLNRQALYLRPDPARVIVRPFKPATEPRDLNPTDKTRANHIVERVLALDPKVAASLLKDVLENFEGRHRNLLETFELRADEMEEAFAAHGSFSEVQRQLIGAYFLNEYSFEASALFNPSIVPHPDQSGAPKGGLRFVLSLRATGEGHVSSLTFRAGTIAADGSLTVDPTARLASSPRISRRVSGPDGDPIELTFNPEEELSERVIFPVTEFQSNGIEDARFVEFTDEDRKTYYATYTAFSGRAIRSELIETADFLSFRMSPLKDAASRNKGMALFPRKIDSKYAMIARQDNENLYLIYSDDLYTWDGG